MARANEFNLPQAAREKYTRGSEIARGKYGVVFKCESVATKKQLACKIMLKKGNKRDDVMREVDILKKISHPGILELSDFMESDKEYVLVTELLNGGELFDYVLEKEYLDEKQASHYLEQLLTAVDYFHQKKIVHLDLKPENIVLKERDGEQLKIIDFGTAQDLGVNPRPKVMAGTPEFIAPEVLNYDPVSSACDMWSIGIITYVLLTGMSPFLGDNDMETINSIASGEYEYPDPDPAEGYEDISSLAKDFIDSLLQYKASDRNDAKTSLSHKWLTTSDSKLIGTARLKSFRARRRWLAVTRAARLSISFSKMALVFRQRTASTSTSTCPVNGSPSGSPGSCGTL